MKTPFELIKNKQNGHTHTAEEIAYLVNGFTAGKIPDYQISAWLMAIFFKGMSRSETLEYTKTMIESGERLDFSYLPGFVVDKHSTGGVGDKVSLILGPLLAACGCYVPMLSGRGLGHTGGTLDKLESIPGYKTDITLTEFKKIVASVGVSIIGQTGEICPADKKLYALRDVTSTVASLPLICGSIMSKKIAEGIKGLVLDVKCGNGAFMTKLSDAQKLAQLLTDVGKSYGLEVAFSITDMNQPLGNAAGVWCEVQESVAALQGDGPHDLKEVTFHLCEQALKLAGETGDLIARLETAVSSGKAYEKFTEMVSAQNGVVKELENPKTHIPKYQGEIKATRSGYISELNAFKMGMSLISLGGGRKVQTDVIDPTAGFYLNYKLGQKITRNDVIAEVFCSDQNKLKEGKVQLENSIKLSGSAPKNLPLIYD